MRQFFLCFAAIGALCSTGVAAQTERPTGSNIKVPSPAQISTDRTLSENEKARRVVEDFGRCIVQYDDEAVRQLIASAAFSEESEGALLDLANSQCLRSGTLKMPQEIMRGSLFRAKLAKEFEDASVSLANEAFDYRNLVDGEPSKSDLLFVATRSFASCVFRANPEVVLTFVISSAGTDAEDEALQQLIPHLSPCLPADQEFQFNRSMLEAFLSEAAYRELQKGMKLEQPDA